VMLAISGGELEVSGDVGERLSGREGGESGGLLSEGFWAGLSWMGCMWVGLG
jgi:hypothetical protein